MEYVENTTVLKDFIDKNLSGKTDVDHLINFIGRGLGTLIAKLHSKHIIHGDLTTSNLLLKKADSNELSYNDDSKGNLPITTLLDTVHYNVASNSINARLFTAEIQFVMIDFGLARVDSTLEDKAVDLYVLERSLLSAHSEVPTLFPRIFHYYQQCYQDKKHCEQVLSKYKQVQARGRKRLMIG